MTAVPMAIPISIPRKTPPIGTASSQSAVELSTEPGGVAPARAYIPELLEALRAGTVAEPVPVMTDGSTFAIHGATRTFWVKLWHAAGSELTKIDRAQVISCLPSTRGVQVVVDTPEEE